MSRDELKAMLAEFQRDTLKRECRTRTERFRLEKGLRRLAAKARTSHSDFSQLGLSPAPRELRKLMQVAAQCEREADECARRALSGGG